MKRVTHGERGTDEGESKILDLTSLTQGHQLYRQERREERLAEFLVGPSRTRRATTRIALCSSLLGTLRAG